MKICVISPLHGQCGSSTASVFVSMSLALINNSRVCLTHADFSSNVIKNSFSLPIEKDVTTSLTQVTKLIQTGNIKTDDLLSYTQPILKSLYLYSTFQPNIEANLFDKEYEFLIRNMNAFEHIVIDYDSGLSHSILNKCVELADLIIIVINQNKYVIEKGLELADRIKNLLEEPDEKKINFLINQYMPSISSYKQVASKLKVKPRNLLQLSYSDYIIKCSNSGRLEECFTSAANNDIRTSSLKQDMIRACKFITSSERGDGY